MIDPDDMKIGVPARYSEMKWNEKEGTDKLGWCSRCGVDSRYPAETVMVIRHWKTDSTAGTWVWYCPAHFETAKPWSTDGLAPEELLP